MPMPETLLKIADIVRDPTLQPREAMNQSTVIRYAERIKDGHEFPAVVVFRIGGKLHLVAGWHRLFAHLEAQKKIIKAVIHEGTWQEAIVAAVKDNAKNPLQRTDGDERRSVRMFFIDEQLRQTPNIEIARICDVNKNKVGFWRQEWDAEQNKASFPSGKDKEPTRTVNRGGKTYKMKVGKIGKRDRTEQEKDSIANRAEEDRLAEVAQIERSIRRQHERLAEIAPSHPWVKSMRGMSGFAVKDAA